RRYRHRARFREALCGAVSRPGRGPLKLRAVAGRLVAQASSPNHRFRELHTRDLQRIRDSPTPGACSPMRITTRKDIAVVAALALGVVTSPNFARAQAAAPMVTRVTPGELVIDPPTLINLGFEWMIEGDDNRNASVSASYRAVGESDWHEGMPLLRLQHEQ